MGRMTYLASQKSGKLARLAAGYVGIWARVGRRVRIVCDIAFASHDPGGTLIGRYGPLLVHEAACRAEASTAVSARRSTRSKGHSNIAATSRGLHLSTADLLDTVDRAFPET